MLFRQLFQMLQVLVFDVFHQFVVLLVSLHAAIFLTDGHGGETVDELILTFDDAKDAVQPGNAGDLAVEGAGHGGKVLNIAAFQHLVHFVQPRPQGGDVCRGRLFDNGGQGQHF